MLISSICSSSFEKFILSSEQIRQKLETKLNQVFLNRESSFYKYLYEGRESVETDGIQIIQLVSTIKFDKQKFERLQTSIDTWFWMYPDDRMSIIQGFLFLFSDYMSDFSAAQKNMIFCSIFINEFIEILSQRVKVGKSAMKNSSSK
jgi:hypothetical protein